MLESLSASLASDGLINRAALAKVTDRIEKAVKAYAPVVKYVKSRNSDFPVTAKVSLSLKSKKEANAIKALVAGLGESVSDISIAGAKDKFVLQFSATTAKTAKKAYEAVSRAPGLVPSPTHYYVVSRKAKTEAPSAAKFKAKNVKHLAKRAVKIAERKKLSDAVVAILPVYAKGVLPSVDALIKTSEAEIKKHIAKAEKVKVLVSGLREKAKTERSANYSAMIAEVMPLLVGAGFKEKDIILGQTMMGQTLYARTPGKHVLTIGLSDNSAFNKARKSNEAAE